MVVRRHAALKDIVHKDAARIARIGPVHVAASRTRAPHRDAILVQHDAGAVARKALPAVVDRHTVAVMHSARVACRVETVIPRQDHREIFHPDMIRQHVKTGIGGQFHGQLRDRFSLRRPEKELALPAAPPETSGCFLHFGARQAVGRRLAVHEENPALRQPVILLRIMLVHIAHRPEGQFVHAVPGLLPAVGGDRGQSGNHRPVAVDHHRLLRRTAELDIQASADRSRIGAAVGLAAVRGDFQPVGTLQQRQPPFDRRDRPFRRTVVGVVPFDIVHMDRRRRQAGSGEKSQNPGDMFHGFTSLFSIVESFEPNCPMGCFS